MVKMTIVGRASDGLPLAQGPRYVNEGDDINFSSYKEQAEFVLNEVATSGPLAPSKMTIRLDHHCFHFMLENGICFITLCHSSYPRRLAFRYLEDLHKEMNKFETSLINKISKPYSFVKFDGVIGNIRKQYVDARTQSNLSKLNAHRRQDQDIMTENMSNIVEKRRKLDMLEKAMTTPRNVSPIWCSSLLEGIALKWAPITLVGTVVTVLLWTSLFLSDNFTIMAL